METIMLVLTIIGTLATVISTFYAIKAKNEAKEILEQIKEENSRNIKNKGKVEIKNSGSNSGVISGINSGEITNGKKR